MAINMAELPREIQDRILLKEDTDSTFYRFSSESYTEIFFETVAQRSDVSAHQSLLVSLFGQQGCHLKGAKVTTLRGLVNIEDVVAGDCVWAGGAWRSCVPIHKGVAQCKAVTLNNNQVLQMTPDHVMKTNRGWVKAEDLVVGDSFVAGDVPWSAAWTEESERAAVVAMLLADGHVDVLKKRETYDYVRKSDRVMRKQPKKEHEWLQKRVRFYKADASLRRFMQDMLKKHYCASAAGEYTDYGTASTKVVCIQNEAVFNAVVAAGVPVGKKSSIVRIPEWISASDAAMNGFLAGYFACDGSFYQGGIEISSCSKELADQLVAWLQSKGCVVRIIVVNRSSKHAAHADIYRLFIRNKDSLRKWVACVRNLSDVKKVVLSGQSGKRSSIHQQLQVVRVEQGELGEVFDLHVQTVHEYVVSGLVSHNSGKSYSALALCKMLDPNFDVKTQCYFNYNKLVYDRASFKPGMAILVDEQSQSYGLDSHRIMIILSSIKEQLRKRSIHLIFCAPVLYEESKSSMYIIETMFIDRENEVCVCALKTRDGLTLGHVEMPSPLKKFEDGTSLFTQEEIDIYEAHKDAHLDTLLGKNSMDEFEERAQNVMKHPVFMAAEKIYKARMGYVPQTMVVQIINKIYPEYNAGVVPYEIAQRIKLDKELAGEWQIAGGKKTEDGGKGKTGRRSR